MIEDDITIRSVQHYLYCPHRWGLMEIDCAWSENYFVTKANIIHERVHNPKSDYSLRGVKHYTSVSVYNDEYGLYGITDCIEVTGQDRYRIVEYKPTRPKGKDFNYDDLIQVFAQKVCVDKTFNCDSEGIIYYADDKKRVKLPFEENYDEYNGILKQTLSQMRELLQKGKIPEKIKGQKCSGCSMKDICMPNLSIPRSIRKSIEEISDGE